MNRKKKCFYGFTLLLVLTMMVLIFCFSGENADMSSDLSGGICERFVETLNRWFQLNMGQEKIGFWAAVIETPIRKCAHFLEYMALSFCVNLHTLAIRSLRMKENLHRESKREWIQGMAPYLWKTLLFCFLYACTDELHQYFVPGRACRFFDVCVDTTGAFFGTVLFLTLPFQKVTMLLS